MRLLFAGGSALLVLVLAQLPAFGVGAAVATMGALLVVNLLAARRDASSRRGGGDPGDLAAPLAACWLALAILPVHNVVLRSNTAAVSQVGIEPVVELAYFLFAGAFAVTVIGRLEPELRLARPPTLLLVLPIWVCASATWSATGPYAFVRGVQFLLVSLLAWATLALARRDPAHLTAMLSTFFCWFVRIALVLIGLGVLLGPIYVPAGGRNLQRFTWIGAHPNGSALVITAAVLIAVTAPLDALRMRPGWRAVAVAVLLAALYANHSRTAWLEFVVAALLVFFFAGRLRPLVHWVGVPVLGFVVVAVWVFWWDAIWGYILREGDSDDLASGHGRMQLWGVGFRSLETPFDWFCGRGYGVSRTLFLSVGPWAKSAHNSVLSWLVSGGIVALVLVLTIVFVTIRNLWGSHVIATRPDGLALVAFFTVVGANGLASDSVAEPGLGYVGVIFTYAVSVAIVEARARRAAGDLAVPPEPTARS